MVPPSFNEVTHSSIESNTLLLMEFDDMQKMRLWPTVGYLKYIMMLIRNQVMKSTEHFMMERSVKDATCVLTFLNRTAECQK